MIRERNFKKFYTRRISHPSLDAFLEADPIPGIHSVRLGNSEVDLLLEERNTHRDILMVYFPSGVGDKNTYPHFQGRLIAKSLKMSLLTISDPAIMTSSKISTNFYLGHSSLDLPAVIDEIIRKLAQGRRILFVGPSAGGFSALLHGDRTFGSLTFVMNAETNLLLLPSFVEEGKEEFFPDKTFKEVAEMRQLMIKKVSNHVVYAQNLGDGTHVEAHMLPFFEQNVGNGSVAVHWGNWGPGHVGMPKHEQISLLQAIVDANNWDKAIDTTGMRYKTLSELKRDRINHSNESTGTASSLSSDGFNAS